MTFFAHNGAIISIVNGIMKLCGESYRNALSGFLTCLFFTVTKHPWYGMSDLFVAQDEKSDSLG